MKDYTSMVPKQLLREYIDLTKVIDETRPLAFLGDHAPYVKAHGMRAKLHDEILQHVGTSREDCDFAAWLAVKTDYALHYPHLTCPWSEACPAE
jgi:hypothetical protein